MKLTGQFLSKPASIDNSLELSLIATVILLSLLFFMQMILNSTHSNLLNSSQLSLGILFLSSGESLGQIN